MVKLVKPMKLVFSVTGFIVGELCEASLLPLSSPLPPFCNWWVIAYKNKKPEYCVEKMTLNIITISTENMAIKSSLKIDQIQPQSWPYKKNAWSISQPTVISKVLWPTLILTRRCTLSLNLSKRRLLRAILARCWLALRSNLFVWLRCVARSLTLTSHLVVFSIPYVATLRVVRRVLMVADFRLGIALLLRYAFCFVIFSPSNRRKKTADHKVQRVKIRFVVNCVY